MSRTYRIPRIGKHSSQGLAGAQGSGGGAERGVNDAPPSRPYSAEVDDEEAVTPEDETDLDEKDNEDDEGAERYS